MVEPIAIYLPQFHETEENNLWWGKGFTEWVNVRSAVPAFAGHYQPHIPHQSIGYYDLTDMGTLIRQHALAYRYGIKNFCYYYYNFNGKTLLESPLKLIAESNQIKNKFCLCWANGNWTRAWYGQNKEILIAQEYSEENALQFIQAIISYITHPRYICVDGKPLLLVYRPEIIEVCKKYSEIWQNYIKQAGLPGLYLVGVEALEHDIPPALYGFDAALEFAPDWRLTHLLSAPEEKPRIYDYVATVSKMIAKPTMPYPRFRCVFPGWDNSARYKKGATIFVNNSWAAFAYFLEATVKYTQKHMSHIAPYFFINAWNEWGEGCHIEPDQQNGFAALQTIHRVLQKI